MKFKYADYFFYKLVCLSHDVDLSYVGSTSNWRQRKRTHKSSCNNENDKAYNTKKYQLMRENGGFENFKMVQIGFKEHLTQREAEAVEEDYRVEIRANMNGQRCSSNCKTQQEYNKKYQQEHKQEILDYRQEHKQEKTEYDANRYKENHQKLTEKVECSICGGRYTLINKTTHEKTKKHEKAVSNSPSTSTDNSSISN